MAQNVTTASDVVTKVSRQLSDDCPGQEFTTWSKEQLTDYLNDALCQIMVLRPDAFASVENITLTSGECQDFSEQYHAVLEIGGVSPDDEATNIQSEKDILKHFRKTPCLTAAALSGRYSVESFRVNPVLPAVFDVVPAVPSGETAVVKATVVKHPPRFCDDLDAPLGVGCEYEAVICDWLLHRAHSVEAESSPTSLNLMQYYRESFYNTFNINYRQAQRFNSGFYLGREGDGDQSFRSR